MERSGEVALKGKKHLLYLRADQPADQGGSFLSMRRHLATGKIVALRQQSYHLDTRSHH